MVRTSSPNPKSPAKSKASKQQQTLPSVAAVQDALPWTPGHGGRAVGRTAVADTDLPAGCLVMQERALLLIPRSGTASHVCHACLEPMMPAKAQKGPGGAEDGTSNPLLPRYCSRACAAPRLLRDGHLLPLRRGLADISREHGVDPELLHLVALLDLDGGTGAPAAPAPGPAPAEPGAGAPPPPPLVVACGPADVACLHSSWDKRPAPWRGALGPALRAVHAQLAALAAGGKLAGYAAPGTLPELQARAAMLATNLVGTGPSTEAGLALFPGLASFSHSCMPNCIWIAAGDTVYVRTVTPIKAGEPLTLSFAPLYEPRSVRKQTLAMERGVSCACTRCVSPLATSSDRFLEGVWCLACRRDVLVEAANQESAAAEYEAQACERERRAAGPHAARLGRGGGKHKGRKATGGGAAAAGAAPGASAAGAGYVEEEGMPAGEETPVAGHESVPSTPRPGAADSPPAAEAQAADHSQCCGGHGDHSHHHHAPPPLTFPGKWWKCCGCGSVAPGVAEQGLGPQQLVQRADLLWQQGLMLHNMKAYSQSEQILRVLCAGLAGRLHPLHARVIDALTPLLNINIQRGETVTVFNLALQLWEAERSIVDRPTLTQLTYLGALVEAAHHKATHANSSVVRKQFDRKYKLAHSELVFLRKMMLGPEE
uniref:SET domain-containing protein n=1 Tax=Auxenochlorella protothecoides TaxID=3075 RepID=A0A1D2A7K7_AUXPR